MPNIIFNIIPWGKNETIRNSTTWAEQSRKGIQDSSNATETSSTEIVNVLCVLDLPQNLGLPKILGSSPLANYCTSAVNIALITFNHIISRYKMTIFGLCFNYLKHECFNYLSDTQIYYTLL